MKPVSVTLLPWLRANLGKRALAPLTSTDHAALLAAVQVVALYAQTEDDSLPGAFAACVRKMQMSTREFAFHSIAHVMDWPDRGKLWALAGLEPLERRMRCQYEPGGAR